MSVRVLPAVVAVVSALVLAFVLFVPFVAREHRRRGELGWGTAALRFAALLYASGLLAYVLIPLPPVAPGFCEAFAHLAPQWEPFAGFGGVRRPGNWAELSPLLTDDVVQQFGFNILLFVPLGMLGRHLSGRNAPAVALAGFATSLVVELTQLTGVWFLYPCPYRLFDVDDLIANTSGALVGALLAPALRRIPGQPTGTPAATPRKVTIARRLLGMCCDVLLLWWLGSILLRATDAVAKATGVRWPQTSVWWESTALWFGPAVIVALATTLLRGTSLGQHAVLLRVLAYSGERPRAGATLRRWLAGIGGLALAQGLLNALGVAHWGAPLAVVWCTVHAFGVTRTRTHRGISHRIAGLQLEDARTARRKWH